MAIVGGLSVSGEPAPAQVKITLNDVDPPGVGLTDVTPAAPIGGNPGTTRGQQRMNALRFAADLWGSILDSDVEIVVQVTFDAPPPHGPLFCTPTSAVAAATGAVQMLRDFPNAPLPHTWYPGALANKLAGSDLTPGPPDPGFMKPPFNDDFILIFDGRIDEDPECGGTKWYYGLDDRGDSGFNLVKLALHQMAHGLGLEPFVDRSGRIPLGSPSVFMRFMLDLDTGKHWSDMTRVERAASGGNCGDVVWDGERLTAAAPSFVQRGHPALLLRQPARLAREVRIGPATFGPGLAAPGVTGRIVLVADAEGQPTDGCQPLTAASAAQVAGQIALMDRGGCPFDVKVTNAEAAGAAAAVVADSAVGSCPPPQLGGRAPVGIPAGRIGKDDRDAIVAALPDVVATLGLDTGQLAGADAAGRMRLWPVQPSLPSTSVAHLDNRVTPNLLMEFNINPDLPVGVDLAAFWLMDLGWTLTTVKIGGCDTGVPNYPLPDGGTVAGRLERCLGTAAPADEERAACIGRELGELRAAFLGEPEQRALRSCAARIAQAPGSS
jgi:hypothetical protein